MHISAVVKFVACFDGASPILKQVEGLLSDTASQKRRLCELSTALLQLIAGKVVVPMVRNDDTELSRSASMFLADINEELAARVERSKTLDDLRPSCDREDAARFRKVLGYLLETTSGLPLNNDLSQDTLSIVPSKDYPGHIHIGNEAARSEEHFKISDLVALARMANLDP